MEECSSSISVEEIEIPVPWGNICGKWWGPRQVRPIVALHGWQDNAGTFDNLAPLLPPTVSLLAIDLPGHGKSSHYPLGQSYFLYWDGLAVLRRIVKHFKWDKISILGHSLGGGIGFMYAGSYPDEVEHLICIDIVSPVIKDSEKMVAGISASVDKVLAYEKILDKVMPAYTYDEALELVLTAYRGSLTRDSCKILMKRGLEKSQDGKGYHFRRDVRVKIFGLGYLSKETVMGFAANIKCKVLNIKARPGMIFDKEEYYHEVLSKMRESAEQLEFHEVPGTHHLHLNEPMNVLPIIVKFLKL
ncbi:probable serine hydrolase [Hetaerina americana]|uniref:probable serine hydrolase n=1 Tax=Hetaerina americana TaxID=62018 RepID=UPI003A7F2EA9